MKKRYIIIITMIYLILPLGIDKFLMNRFYTNWNLEEWAGFLGSYLGGGISGVITLGGIWWQLNRNDKKEKKEKIIGVLKSILYSLNQNLNDERLEKLMLQSFYVLDYQNKNTVYHKFYTTYIYEIFPEVIKENYKTIFELDFGSEIIKLDDLIKDFNQNHKFLALELKNKREIVDKIEKTINEQLYYYSGTNANEILKNIKEISKFFSSDLKISSKEIILKNGEELHKNIDDLTSLVNVEDTLLDKTNKLQQYTLSEMVLLNNETNIFKIIEEMEKVKKYIEDEIKKIENK